jgi:hypothetical protein
LAVVELRDDAHFLARWRDEFVFVPVDEGVDCEGIKGDNPNKVPFDVLPDPILLIIDISTILIT